MVEHSGIGGQMRESATVCARGSVLAGAAALLLACALPGAAAAQVAPPSQADMDRNETVERINPRDMARWELTDEQFPLLASPRKAEEAYVEAGRCMAATESATAGRYVRNAAMSDPKLSRSRVLPPDGSACVESGRSGRGIGGRNLVAALFDAMYRRDFSASAPGAVKDAPALAFAGEYDGDAAAIPPAVIGLRAYGDCVARLNADGVHAMLLTDYGSDAEGTAFVVLQPTLGTCVNSERNLRFTRLVLRGTLAEALYKLRKAGA